MNFLFPPPAITPFERLQARDGLLITADRWKRVQNYHRQRQNFHYQSLHQPGIVCGLGVRPISREDTSQPVAYRDGRSFQLLPGIALDLMGNPIIVPEPTSVQIGLDPLADDPLTVYVVVSYRDPEELAIPENQEMMREQFRIDIKTRPPEDLEVEVCRVLLPPGQPIQLAPAPDIFFPGYNNLDFRFRRQAGPRASTFVRISQIRHDDPDYNRNFANLDYLMKAVPALYPDLEAGDRVGMITWEAPELLYNDVLYLTGQRMSMSQPEAVALERYLRTGGVLVVDIPPECTEMANYIAGFAQQRMGTPLEPLSRRHPLRRQPFLFAALPANAKRQPVQVYVGGGLILILGDLGSTWGLDEELALTRPVIRASQEFGVNLLYFAWQKRVMTQLQL